MSDGNSFTYKLRFSYRGRHNTELPADVSGSIFLNSLSSLFLLLVLFLFSVVGGGSFREGAFTLLPCHFRFIGRDGLFHWHCFDNFLIAAAAVVAAARVAAACVAAVAGITAARVAAVAGIAAA